MGFGVTELLIILAIVLVLFGAKKLRNIGGDLGGAIKNFKSAVKEEENKTDADSLSNTNQQATIDNKPGSEQTDSTFEGSVENKDKDKV